MLPIDRGNLWDLLIALGVVAAGTLLWSLLFATPARAQLAVSDAPVEANTTLMTQQLSTANSTLSSILGEDTATATSVTTGGGAGLFQGQAPFLDAMMQTLASGIPDAATYAAYFAGWVDFGPSAALLAATITNKIIQTDLNTLTVYQSLVSDFDGEDATLNRVEACNQAAGAQQSVLYALQCTNEAIMNLAQHVQLLEAAQLVRGINEVVHHGYELNTDAQSGANLQTWLTQAAQSQE